VVTEKKTGISLEDITEELQTIQDSLRALHDKLTGIVGMEWKVLPAEYLRIGRKELRGAMSSIASSSEALAMIPYTIPAAEPQPKDPE
jgi:hypothetical protein